MSTADEKEIDITEVIAMQFDRIEKLETRVHQLERERFQERERDKQSISPDDIDELTSRVGKNISTKLRKRLGLV